MNDVTELLAVLPVSSDRAKRFAREVSRGNHARGMGLVLPSVTPSVPSWSPDYQAGPAPAPAPAVHAPSGAVPSWSPDYVPPAPPTPASVNPFADHAPAQAPAPAASSWWTWPPSPRALAVGGGALALALLGWAILRRRGGAAAPASAPIIVLSSRPEAASPVKANRPRFVRKGR